MTSWRTEGGEKSKARPTLQVHAACLDILEQLQLVQVGQEVGGEVEPPELGQLEQGVLQGMEAVERAVDVHAVPVQVVLGLLRRLRARGRQGLSHQALYLSIYTFPM